MKATLGTVDGGLPRKVPSTPISASPDTREEAVLENRLCW